MGGFTIVDGAVLSALVLFVLIAFALIWERWLKGLEPRYQRLIDLLAIALSVLVILFFASGRALFPF